MSTMIQRARQSNIAVSIKYILTGPYVGIEIFEAQRYDVNNHATIQIDPRCI